MTPLEKHLISLIKQQGPITIAQLMQVAVSDKHLGYYAQKDPFGAGGDFITSPEISQMFGELMGVWCAHYWQQMGSPANFVMAELGPGRGTLMKDLLRGSRHVKGFHAAMEIHLVETSPLLREKQQQMLLGENMPKAYWHESFSALPEKPMLLIANEFFDALPIHQFVRSKQEWCEKILVVDGSGGLNFSLATENSPAAAMIPAALANAPEGTIFETSPLSNSIVRQITTRIVRQGGAALIIDYGYEMPGGKDTLQAVSHHHYHPVLDSVGEADLTAHVDFNALHEAAVQSGAKSYPVLTQASLLGALGIHFRANSLMQRATPEQQERILTELIRLTDKDQMGQLFKCMAITRSEGPAPIGFQF